MIDLTPVDVRKKKGDFRRTMRGYDPAMVDDFLDLVADRLDQLVRETIALGERVGREDQQIAEYRERERALTEALVTAQEMREEIRQQTSRDAEAVRQDAEREVAALRAAVEQEVAEVREAAAREAAELRAAAQQEVARLRSIVEQDTAELRTTVKQEREREEEVVRQLRLRQQQLLGEYRAALERELAELGTVAENLGLAADARAVDALARAAAAAAGLVGGIASAGQAVQSDPDASAEPERDATAAEAVAHPMDEARAAPAGAGPVGGSAAGPAADMEMDSEVDAEVDLDVDAATGPPAPFVTSLPSMFPEDEDDDSDLGVVVGFDLFEPEPLEPFAPEPFDPTDAETAPDAAAAAALEDLELYEGIAEDAADDGVPGPIGLPAGESASPDSWKLEAAWSVEGLELTDEADGTDQELAILGEAAALENDDEDAARLLRNAEEAGYQLPDDGEEELLLLEEAVFEEEFPAGPDAEPQADADEWLGTFLEDEK